IRMVEVVQQLATWQHFPRGLTSLPQSAADEQEKRERYESLDRLIKHFDSVLMPLRAKFNALAIQVLKGMKPKEPEGNSRHVDGPEAGVRFWYDNKSFDVKNTSYQVLAHVWNKETCSFISLKGVLKKPEAADATVNTWISRLNVALPAFFPWRFECDGV